MSVHLTRFDETHVKGATDEIRKCSLCTAPFVLGRGEMGTVVVLDKVNGGDVVAAACLDCCPDRLTAIENHMMRPWYVRLFTRPDYKRENYDILVDVGRFQVYMDIVRKARKACSS